MAVRPEDISLQRNLMKNWDRNSLRNPHRLGDKSQRVREMFDSIAGSYDLLNHVLSLNLDRRWRRRAVQLCAVRPGETVLDVCCGTGDLAWAFVQAEPALKEVVGVDFAPAMLARAAAKGPQEGASDSDGRNGFSIRWLCDDAESLCLADESFDCGACAFGIRNLQSPAAALRELFRVLRPGGRAVVLEFALPINRWLRWGYMCYFGLVLPALGRVVSRDHTGAYHYLPASVRTFDSAEQIGGLLRDAGFVQVRIEKLTGGVVLAWLARKP